jgi:flagellar assembly factor FliW
MGAAIASNTPPADADLLRVVSQTLGALEIDRSSALRMAEPIPGFPECREYALLGHVRGDGEVDRSVWWLQALAPNFHAFVVTDPWLIAPDYSPEIPDAEAAELRLSGFGDAQVLAILTLTGGSATVNLRAPVVVNAGERIAKQVVLLGDEYGTRQPLSAG